MALVTTTSEAAALALTADLRAAAQATWKSRDAQGIDVSAIEHMDRRCIEIVREDGADRRCAVTLDADADVVLFVHLELPAGASPALVAQLHDAVDATLRSPEVARKFTDLGADPQFGTPKESAT